MRCSAGSGRGSSLGGGSPKVITEKVFIIRKTPKLPLNPEEREALRRAGLRLSDFLELPPEEISRAAGEVLPPERVRHLKSLVLFQQLPYVGPATAEDLVRLGYAAPADLAGADAGEMFRRLEALTGQRLDPCVEDVLYCAIYYAEHPGARPDRPWWAWSASRLAGRADKTGGSRQPGLESGARGGYPPVGGGAPGGGGKSAPQEEAQPVLRPADPQRPQDGNDGGAGHPEVRPETGQTRGAEGGR